MAAPSKKRMTGKDAKNADKQAGDPPADQQEAMSGVEGDEDVDEGAELIHADINVDFEARNPEQFDFHGIRKLLHQLLLKANVDLSELANQIIAQNHVGSVIKQVEPSGEEDSDDDSEQEGGDVFGIVTVVNLSDKKDQEWVQQLKASLSERCAQKKKSGKKNGAQFLARFNSVWDGEGKHVGLIINERFINLPAQISLPSFDSLWKEVERARLKDRQFDMGHYLMIAKTYVDSTSKNDDERIFINLEEQIFFDNADATFDYSVESERDTGMSDQWDNDTVLEPIRTVMLISADKLPAIMQRMRAEYSQ